MGDPVDQLIAAGGRSGVVEPEQGDDAIDVDQEQGTVHE
jgi:hypothetical protein